MCSHSLQANRYGTNAVDELNYSDAITKEFSFGSHLNARDERAVRKTVAGYLKLLHPDGRWTHVELRQYLELALEARLRVKQQLKILAPHEYARTAFSYLENDTEREIFVQAAEDPNGIDLHAADELDVIEAEVLEQGEEMPIGELLKLPESQTLEFKSAMRYDLRQGGANKALEQVIVKSVSGLMNARGGVLLIGVADDGEVLGIEQDLKMLPKRQDIDGYANHMTTLLEQSIGAAATANAHVMFEQLAGKNICRVAVKPSSSPVWTKLKGVEEAFFLRLNNSTRPLGPREAHEYIRQHFR